MNEPDDFKGDYIGRTASDDDDVPDFEEVPVWVDPRKEDAEPGSVFDDETPDPDLNSFAVIEREGVLQYGRISSGYEYSSRADPGIQQRDKSMGYDPRPIRESALDEDVYRLIRIELLGEVVFLDEEEIEEDGKSWEVRRPTKLPQVGQKVHELGATELAQLLEMPDEDEGLQIGTIESGGEEVEFRLDSQFISRHLAILGRTGVGKSHTGHVLIEEMIRHEKEGRGVPVVTFDAEDDVTNMAEDVGGITLEPEDDTMPVPFQLIGWSEFNRFLGSMPSEKQRQVIAHGYNRIHQEALENLEQEGELGIGEEKFEQYVKDAADIYDYTSYKGQAVRRATSVINGSDVLSESMNNWNELMKENPIINIDISGLGDSNRSVVISAVARLLRILRTEGEVPPFVLAIDEAHEFVPSGRSTESTAVVRDLVKTARHIGIGVMLMTQSPSELDSRTLRTCNTYITLALSKPEVKEIEGLLSDLSDRSIKQIPNMERGRAYVGASRDIMTHTVPVNVRERRTPEGAPTPNLMDDSLEWFGESNQNSE